MSISQAPDEAALRRLIGTKAYWDQRHPDHQRVNEYVREGYELLYDPRKESKVNECDLSASDPFERGRQLMRGLLMAQASNAAEKKGQNDGQQRPTIDIPVKRPIPEIGPSGPLERAGGWIMKQRSNVYDWLGKKAPELDRPPGPGGTRQ
ncbi:MAG: hypothetical protein HQL44_12225 [Alphaproteobacteria bacterium]|nr:hypothetical protein [Alphaproteobacteria bacterium]